MSQKPLTLHHWLILNLQIGSLSFGSSARILLYQNAVVEKNKWLNANEFQEILTIAQVLPGPNLVNVAAYLGNRLLGVRAAILAVLLLALPGALLIVALSFTPLENPFVAKLFQGFSIASIILFSVFIYQLIKNLDHNPGHDHLPQKKLFIRSLIAISVGACSYAGISMIPLIFITSVICLLVEFFL